MESELSYYSNKKDYKVVDLDKSYNYRINLVSIRIRRTSPSTRATARASNFNIIICLVYQPLASRTEVTLHKYK
jgi:hypothetical protein